MTDDRGYDRDNQWGVGIEVIQKEHYYNYFTFPCLALYVDFAETVRDWSEWSQ